MNNSALSTQTKVIPLNEYIRRIKNLGYEDDQVQGMIGSLSRRGIITVDQNTSMVIVQTLKH